MSEEITKSKLKKTIETAVDEIKATATTTAAPITTTATTLTTTEFTTPEASGEDPLELLEKSSYECLDCSFDNPVIAVLVKDDSSEDVSQYDVIIPESLDPDAFVICENECESEGFWMMIGKRPDSVQLYLNFSFHCNFVLVFVTECYWPTL